jgi:ankyrin repeat protein
MSKLINLIYDNASIEEIKADLYDNRHNKDYVNVVDIFGRNALIYGCKNGKTEVVKLKLLLEAGADVNIVDAYDMNAFMHACMKGNTESVKLLLAEDADVNVVDVYGRTPLKIAEEYGHTEIVELLNNAISPNSLSINKMLEKLITRIHNLMQLDNVKQSFVIEIYNIYNVNYRFKHYNQQLEQVKCLDSAMLSPIKEVALAIFCNEVNKYLDEIEGSNDNISKF